jgi:steroid delta-isomerase-like uncharacterized protein
MPVEQNIELMHRWFREVWNEGRTQTIHDLLSPNAVARGQGGPQEEIHGPAEFVLFVERIRSAFSDINITVEDAFGTQDRVVVRWSAAMTHSGDGLGIPASGKPVRITGITIARILDGLIVEGWDSWSQLGMLQQIGAYTQPELVILAKSA